MQSRLGIGRTDEKKTAVGVAPDRREPPALAAGSAQLLLALQHSAGNAAVSRLVAEGSGFASSPSMQVMRHPALTVLRRAGRWLVGRATRMISKHIARHGRRIAGRAHSVFRLPRKIRSYVELAIADAEQLAASAAAHGADDILEGPGIRIFREAVRGAPGKFRTHVEREFLTDIGTRGERILKIVIDASGRLVTAYPIERFTAIAAGAAAVAIFDEKTAEASERIRSRIEAEEQDEESDDILTTILDFVFDPSVAGEGEDLIVDIDAIVEETTRDVVRDIEEEEGVCLEEEDVEALRNLVAAAISTPMMLEEAAAESE